MLHIDHLIKIFAKQFEGNRVTPMSLAMKIADTNRALEIIDPDALQIRASFGVPIVDETSIEDWDESECVDINDLSDDVANTQYVLYELWYDDEDSCIEMMLYIPTEEASHDDN